MKSILTSALLAVTLAAGCATTPAAPSTPTASGVANTTPEPVLAPAVPAHLMIDRDTLAQRRQVHLDRLLAYANAGVFPTNTYDDGGPLNVFIDDNGKICAAANLMMQDGHADLVRATAAKDNFIVLAQVHDGPLYDWILTSGLTQEEIAMIQEPYMPAQFEPAEPGPSQDPVIAKSWQQQEVERLQNVLRGVHQVLSANTDKSLAIAADRLADARIVAAR